MDVVRRIEMLMRVADAGSFAKAADSLGVTASAMSRAVAELEKELRAALLYRTTRALRLTEEGEELYRRGREILDRVSELEPAISRTPGRLTGTLRVGMSPSISRYVLMPGLAGFMRRYPGLKVECFVLNQPKEMYAAGADLMLRIGDPPESGLIARRIGDLRYAVYGAPEYLKAAGEPSTPDDLSRHRCLVLKAPQETKPMDEWTFEKDGERKRIKIEPTLLSNDREAIITALVCGAGLYRASFFDPFLVTSGRIRRVLTDWSCVDVRTAYAIYRKTPRLSPKLAAFLEFAAEAFASFDPQEEGFIHNPTFGQPLHRRLGAPK
jgi:LysR family transcriptional regulator for bpeEF and oprC